MPFIFVFIYIHIHIRVGVRLQCTPYTMHVFSQYMFNYLFSKCIYLIKYIYIYTYYIMIYKD